MTAVVGMLLLGTCVAAAVMVTGLVRTPRTLDRLHYTGMGGLLVAPPLLVAVLLSAGPGERFAKTLLVVALVIVAGPLLNHATLRAVLTRERGDLVGDQDTDDEWEVTS